MKMKYIAVLICMLLIMTVLSVSGTVMVERTSISTSLGDTLYVGGSGPGNYSTIQEAVDATSDGDTVYVFDDSSPYYENVVVDESINLVGEDKATTIIDGFNNDNVVNISANRVTITGFTIQNGKWQHRSGLIVWSNFNTISDNIITLNDYGIDIMEDSSYNLISENIIIDNQIIGLSAGWYSDYNTIKENIISSSNGGIGISMCSSRGNKIIGNIISQHHMGIKFNDNVRCIVVSNTIANNTKGLQLHFSRGDIIMNNNFLNNDRDAFFLRFLFDFEIPIKHSLFLRNYWNEPLSNPKIIHGELWGNIIDIKWINFDWFPAQEPYDIGV